jgi:hypothetical protein
MMGRTSAIKMVASIAQVDCKCHGTSRLRVEKPSEYGTPFVRNSPAPELQVTVLAHYLFSMKSMS